MLDIVDGLGDLVDVTAMAVGPCAPLATVDRSEVAVFARPLIPYTHPVLLEILHVGVAMQEPQKFVNNRFEVQFFGGDQGEALAEVEAHLIAEDAASAGAGAVAFIHTMVEDMLKEVEILFHIIAEGLGVR